MAHLQECGFSKVCFNDHLHWAIWKSVGACRSYIPSFSERVALALADYFGHLIFYSLCHGISLNTYFEYKIQGDFMDFKSRFPVLDSHLGRPPIVISNRKMDRSEIIIHVALYIDTLKNNLSLILLKRQKYMFFKISQSRRAVTEWVWPSNRGGQTGDLREGDGACGPSFSWQESGV